MLVHGRKARVISLACGPSGAREDEGPRRHKAPKNTTRSYRQPRQLPTQQAPRTHAALFFARSYHGPMDDIVRQAIAKWPNVPHCYGWLGLDRRGHWYMRDDRVQAAGPFPASKGALLRHEKLIDFIQRNYEHDDRGQWFFQNGPQRVYVELEAAPFVWRVAGDFAVASHTGRAAQVRGAVVDETGRLFLDTDLGFGLVHSLDMEAASDAVERGLWQPVEARAAELPQRFGFVCSPVAERSHAS
jgi:hypothetical protein